MPFALPSTNVMFCTTSCTPGFVLQSPGPGGYTCALSQVAMYRIRLLPPPLSVTLFPPSMTSFVPLSLKTFAGVVRTIVTGSGPQLNVMTPPLATAATNASAVQLAALPIPITVVGEHRLSAWPAAGIVAMPPGQPAGGSSFRFVPSREPAASFELAASLEWSDVAQAAVRSEAQNTARNVDGKCQRYRDSRC